MKIAAVLLVMVPLVMSAPHPRAGNPFVNAMLNVFHADELKHIVLDLVAKLGSDENERSCEKECNNYVDIQLDAGGLNTIGHTGCPLVCHSLQELIHFFHIPTNPPTTITI